MKNINIISINCEPKKGVYITVAIQEAIQLSMEQNQVVILKFNSQEYRIVPDKIICDIYNQQTNRSKE